MAETPTTRQPAPTLRDDGSPFRPGRASDDAGAPKRRTWLRNLAAVIAIGGLLAAGCSKSNGTLGGSADAPANPVAKEASPSSSPTQAAPTAPLTITFLNVAIDRGTENVAVGTKVVWTNAETNGVPHNVTSGTVGTTPQPDGRFASAQLLNAGEKFEHAFTAAGTYHYYCALHPAQMQGTITVG